MNTDYTRKVVEAALLAAGRSLTLAELSQLFDQVDRPETEQLRAAQRDVGRRHFAGECHQGVASRLDG